MSILTTTRNAIVMISALLQNFVDNPNATKNSEIIHANSAIGYKHESVSVSLWKDSLRYH